MAVLVQRRRGAPAPGLRRGAGPAAGRGGGRGRVRGVFGALGVRPLEVVRAAWGLVCLLLPGRIITVLGGAAADELARVVLRVLGARHVLQAVVSGVAPGPAVLRVGAWVDGAHGATSLLLAALDRRRARVALVDAAVAAAWCLASLHDARRAQRLRRYRDSRRERVAALVLRYLPLAAS